MDWTDEDPGLPIEFGPCSNGEYDPEPALPPVLRETIRARPPPLRRDGRPPRACRGARSCSRPAARPRRCSPSTPAPRRSTPRDLHDAGRLPRRLADRDGRAAGRRGRARLGRVRVRHPGPPARVPPEPGAERPGLLPGVPAAALRRGRPSRLLLDRALPRPDVHPLGHEEARAVGAPDLPRGEPAVPRDHGRDADDPSSPCARTSGSCCTAQALPNVGTPRAALDAMEVTARTYPIVAWKTFTHFPAAFEGDGNGWYLDDRDRPDAPLAEPFIRKAEDLGLPTICIHKGLSLGSPFGTPDDVGPAARRHPDVNFVIYHSGFETDVAEGPYTAATARPRGEPAALVDGARPDRAERERLRRDRVVVVVRDALPGPGGALPRQAPALRRGGQRAVGHRLPVLRLAPADDPDAEGRSRSPRSTRSGTATRG